MNYIYLLKHLLNYKNYVKYRHHIKINKEDKEIYWLFKALDDLIEKYKTDISLEDFSLWVQVNLGKDYTNFLALIKQTELNEDILEETIQILQERNIASLLAHTALDVSEGKANKDDIFKVVEQFNQLEKQNKPEEVFVPTSLEELYNHNVKEQGLRWRLNILNQSLGSLRKGDFGFIFARPETGKTTFLCSEGSFMASQMKENEFFIWFNNEEQHEKVMLRLIQSTLGLPMKQIALNLKEFDAQYKEITRDKIKVPKINKIHKREIEAICKDFPPGLIVIDQLSKVKGFSNDREDLRLGAAFEWARELAKEYCPIIGVNQADASGENKKYLTMDNVANAKTAIQAEADFILGIGKIHDAGHENIRYLNASKNKLFGDEDSNPAMKHAKMDVLIQPEIARYRDL